MTRDVLSTPDDPDEPSGQFGGPSADVENAVSYKSYADMLNREQPELRVATYAHKDEMFFVTRGDSLSVAMMLEFKPHRSPSASANKPNTGIVDDDPFASEIIKSLVAVERQRRARMSPQRLTGLAVSIAGPKRAALGSEWRSHLSGETGVGLTQDRQVQEAAGFIVAALRYRLQDAADFAWQPVDALLASREISNLVVVLATLGMAVSFLRKGGLYNLELNYQNVAAIWVSCYSLIRIGRWWRDVEPPKHEPRRKR